MSANAYEVLALAMRYVFAGLMVLIVLRGMRITVVDSRRARRLRRLSPQTGIVGEMVVLDGSERAKRGMRYPVTLEGAVGSGRNADIRIRHSSVRPRHAVFLMTDEGLFVRGHARARLRNVHGHVLREITLKDGDIFFIGRVRLLLVLTAADASPEEIVRRAERRYAAEEVLEKQHRLQKKRAQTGPDDLFMSNPAGSRSVQWKDGRRADAPDGKGDADDLFGGDETAGGIDGLFDVGGSDDFENFD